MLKESDSPAQWHLKMSLTQNAEALVQSPCLETLIKIEILVDVRSLPSLQGKTPVVTRVVHYYLVTLPVEVALLPCHVVLICPNNAFGCM